MATRRKLMWLWCPTCGQIFSPRAKRLPVQEGDTCPTAGCVGHVQYLGMFETKGLAGQAAWRRRWQPGTKNRRWTRRLNRGFQMMMCDQT